MLLSALTWLRREHPLLYRREFVTGRSTGLGCDPLNLSYYHFPCASTSVQFSGTIMLSTNLRYRSVAYSRFIFRVYIQLARRMKYGKVSGTCW